MNPTAQIKLTELAKGVAAIFEEEMIAALERLRVVEDEARRRIEAMSPPNELNIDQAAAFLGISKRTLERRVAKRAISYRRDGARLLFTRAALDEYRLKGRVLAASARPLPS